MLANLTIVNMIDPAHNNWCCGIPVSARAQGIPDQSKPISIPSNRATPVCPGCRHGRQRHANNIDKQGRCATPTACTTGVAGSVFKKIILSVIIIQFQSNAGLIDLSHYLNFCSLSMSSQRIRLA
jgi:hypothetical protein